MSSLDNLGRQRDVLPSINTLNFEKYRLEKPDSAHFSVMSNLNHSKGIMGSPPTTYSGPPPPYSSAASAASGQSLGYISPPESNSRRSTRDEKDSPKGTFLPSISEALKNVEVIPPPQPYSATSAPSSAATQIFTEAPKGPGNPFSQPTVPASALRSSLSSNAVTSETSPTKAIPPPPIPPEPRPAPLKTLTSPRTTATQRIPTTQPSTNAPADSPFRTPYTPEVPRPGYPFPDYQTPVPPMHQQNPNGFNFEYSSKYEDSRNPPAEASAIPYAETIKRSLDVWDAEFALQEIADASVRTHEFGKGWQQRIQQGNRASYLTEPLPPIEEIDNMLKYSTTILGNLNKLRDVAVMQQHALDEQRARAAQGRHFEDESHAMSEDFKSGGFAGGDAKKRRGKAAPPGRCHSCNRAETPEWRRGPDGARTLCNACGLHYAKLTRKMGANKAAVMTSSNLRPKSLSDTRP